MKNSISANELEILLETENINIIDVRSEGEFNSGHIKNSINIPLNSIPEACNQLDENETYYIVCRSGARSSRACQFLCSNKNFNAINLDGGIMAWRGDLE